MKRVQLLGIVPSSCVWWSYKHQTWTKTSEFRIRGKASLQPLHKLEDQRWLYVSFIAPRGCCKVQMKDHVFSPVTETGVALQAVFMTSRNELFKCMKSWNTRTNECVSSLSGVLCYNEEGWIYDQNRIKLSKSLLDNVLLLEWWVIQWFDKRLNYTSHCWKQWAAFSWQNSGFKGGTKCDTQGSEMAVVAMVTH